MGILEALSYGLPCLVTTGTTMGDFISQYHAGWHAATDSQSVYDAIIRAIEERDTLTEKSVGAISLIQDKFIWDKVAGDTVEKYRQYIDLGEK